MKPQIKTGDIIFRHSHSFLGRIIQDVIHKPYNHVDIAIAESDNDIYIVGALGRGVMLRSINELSGIDILIRRPVELIDERIMRKKLMDLCDTKYDVTGLLTQLLWHTAGIWTGAKTEEQAIKRLYCYELYWYVYKKYFCTKWWTEKPANSIYSRFTYKIFEGKFIV
jgi:hypothetical protein